jgi:hypothetical protein
MRWSPAPPWVCDWNAGEPELALRAGREHGDADQSHVEHLARALGEVREQGENDAVLLAAGLTGKLYLGMFGREAPPS